ncbi:MAG: orotidine-5'-phosphate decarboxylase [Vicinamibacteria bacterium]
MVKRAPELIVALDVPTLDQALALRQELDEIVGFFKVGKELFTAAGPEILKRLSPARIFLDLKFHDIPQTVFGAVAAAARHGVDLLDVHASGGEAMMRAAAEAARSAVDTVSRSRPLVFGVTVLTHLGDEDLASIGILDSSLDQVMRLAGLAAKSGLDGIVASAWEVEPIREALGDRLQILVPGVRPEWSGAAKDQKRVATPRDAARFGACYIVVGRAIARASSPREAAKRILEELSEP